MLRQSEFRILFSNITERDGGAIIAALEQMNIPYKFNDSGSAILVPEAESMMSACAWPHRDCREAARSVSS
ncbi:MAG: hypothetical protein V5B38_09245 [Candidatus Accumulibacter propinquus]